MIKLYGLRMSNYYSLTKALLIEKGLEFEEVKSPPTLFSWCSYYFS